MKRSDKKNFVQKLKNDLENSSTVIVSHYAGLSVLETDNLRQEMRNNGAKFQVTKNRLTKIALTDTPYEPIADLFSGPTAIAYSEDPVAPARVIKDFLKDNKDSLEILGVFFDGELYDADKYKQLANLPSKEELLGKFISCLNSPMYKLASTLNGSMSKLGFALRAIQK